jgi:LPXTG-motif cell wall-anchored protein
VISTGLASWQVALIAAGAALIGAAVVLLASRVRSARRVTPSPIV